MELSLASTETLIDLKQLISTELYRRRQEARAGRRREYIKRLKPYQSPNNGDLGDEIAAINKYNSENLVSLLQSTMPNAPNDRRKYLPALLAQNWSHLFCGGSTEQCFYVYAHCDPRESIFMGPKICGGVAKGMPFYVGKGTGARAWDLKRNQGHGLKIKDILSAGYKPSDITHIFSDSLTEAQAYELEAKLIYYFGTIYEEGRNGVLLNLDIAKRPSFLGEMAKVPIARVFAKRGDAIKRQAEINAAISATIEGDNQADSNTIVIP